MCGFNTHSLSLYSSYQKAHSLELAAPCVDTVLTTCPKQSQPKPLLRALVNSQKPPTRAQFRANGLFPEDYIT